MQKSSFNIGVGLVVRLQLVEQPVEGVCKTECKTIERACQEVYTGILFVLLSTMSFSLILMCANEK